MNSERSKIIDLAYRLIDSSALNDVCNALESGEFALNSTVVVSSFIAAGRPGMNKILVDLQHIWSNLYSTLSGSQLSLLLQVACEAIQAERLHTPQTQVVWTGPDVDGSYLRATRQVVKDIIYGATHELLVVGYWIADQEKGEGIIHETIELIAKAVTKGLHVNMILDRAKRSDGKDNLEVLLKLWPNTVSLPKVLTWHNPEINKNYKLHAKVLVADKSDALVTSANLTMLAFDFNMEMGVRLVGDPAFQIASHFELLIAKGIIGPYKSN